MNKLRIFGIGALHAALAAAYVILIANVMQRLAPPGPDTSLSVAAFLLVFCISAAIMASLVFLKPLLWYLDGKKKEGLHLLVSTIACLVLAAAAVLGVSYAFAPPMAALPVPL